MQLAVGTRLGPYEIVSPLGEGGMGVVYRARDTKLDRDVAIKVLPALFAADPERLIRFDREAKTLAALNHQNIAQVHGVLEQPPAVVMEFVDGEDLALRLQRGPVPLDDAIAIAKQIAVGLEAAHERGIIHRDLKPANIKVRRDGIVKVLDFGLAKAIGPVEAGFHLRQGSGGQVSRPSDGPAKAGPYNSPTITNPAHLRQGYGEAGTEKGVILGTAPYMSPEQARGGDVDVRTDIWSFGAVLFEMVSGRQAFEGATTTDILAAIVRGEPDWRALPVDAPAAFVSLLHRCLRKDKTKRLHSIADARIELEEISLAPSGAPSPGESRRSGVGRVRPWAAWVASIVAAAAGGALAMRLIPSGSATTAPLQLSIPLASNQQLATSAPNPILVFSPDGSSLVMPVIEDGRQWLVRRRVSGTAVERIEGTEGGTAPFFSPDGRWLGFIAAGRLMKVAAEGGRPFVLAEQQGAGGAAWGADGRMVFAPSYSDGLFRVSADGGSRERLTTPGREQGELGHWWPQILPGGKAALFTAFRSPIDTSRVGVVSLDTNEVRYLVEGGYFARYVRTGHLLYVKGGRLYAAPFDPARAVVTGTAQNVLDDVFSSQADAASLVDVSIDGTLAWVPGTVADPPRELLWVNRDGRTEPATSERRRYRGATVSPDGRTLATAIQGDSVDLWTYSVDRGTLSRMTTGARAEFSPMWSRDGKTLFYVLDRPPFEIQRIAFGASGEGNALWPAKLDSVVSGFSADGTRIAYNLNGLGTGIDVWVGSVEARDPGKAFRATAYEERFGSFSPDGRWLAYESNESGRPEIYVEAFPGPGQRFQISTDGGTEPLWTLGSGEIFYRRGDEMRAVKTRTISSFEFEPARTLFTLSFSRSGSNDRNYDATPNGQRFILSRIPDVAAPRRVDLITQWLDDLARRVPANQGSLNR